MTVCYSDSDWQMTSALTGEAAHRVADGWELEWRLSWLPRRLVSRAQALAGMELAEVFAGNHYRRDMVVAARAILCAAELGMTVEQAMRVLQERRQG
ncbi:hypothetical protein AB0N05_33730 [Nocardia sp. NPDC051030]|uniref:hypothetical protein n=1 Tax=Nocardia sp. NPDC051030 TaxID=3155162 RepID=UPI00342B2301